MSNELANKLKEAGFPQPERDCLNAIQYDLNVENDAYIPPLSELIEACGSELWSLTRHGTIWQTNWRDGMAGDTAGMTPEEAVATLYLKLSVK